MLLKKKINLILLLITISVPLFSRQNKDSNPFKVISNDNHCIKISISQESKYLYFYIPGLYLNQYETKELIESVQQKLIFVIDNQEYHLTYIEENFPFFEFILIDKDGEKLSLKGNTEIEIISDYALTYNNLVVDKQFEIGEYSFGNRNSKNCCNYSAPKIPGIMQDFQQRQVLQLQRRLFHVFLLSRYKNGF